MFKGVRRKFYRAFLIDPPWKYKAYVDPDETTENRRDAERYYETMETSEIAALPVRDLAAPEGSHLFLCAVGPHLRDAFEVLDGLGYEYSGIAFTWVKLKRGTSPLRTVFTERDLHFGLGKTTRKNTEIVLLGRRGNARRIGRDVQEVILRPVREHSRKPDELYRRIERYCAGPYVELFSRQNRPGWRTWGKQAGTIRG